jgi:hypothetical protein
VQGTFGKTKLNKVTWHIYCSAECHSAECYHTLIFFSPQNINFHLRIFKNLEMLILFFSISIPGNEVETWNKNLHFNGLLTQAKN